MELKKIHGMEDTFNKKHFSAQKPRRHTREVMVSHIGIGGDNPVRVQTMTNTDTLDIEGTVKQIVRCVKAGAEFIRLTTQTPKHAEALGKIKENLRKKGIYIPLIADIHFSPAAAFEALKYADKVRINPGNFLDAKILKITRFTQKTYADEIKRIEESLVPFIEALKKVKIPIRVGTNHGSLSDRILRRYGDTPRGMVESTLEYLRIFKKHGFHDIVVGLKASDPLIMIEANRMLVASLDHEKMDYPIHLGVTEAGNAEDGRAKSIIGIGTLLLDGIGDTIRVSLTEPPEKEIPVCYSILQAVRRRITKTEFISCPSCGRTLFDIEKVVNILKKKLGHLVGLRIAVMGCIVNGPGEMADADFGYVGGKKGMVNLYCGRREVMRDIPQKEAVFALASLIKQEGKWIDAE